MTNLTVVRPHLVLAYHGCDARVGDDILSGRPLLPARNDYDWLGTGRYFWEADPHRALRWAQEARDRHATDGRQRASDKIVRDPYVVGAVIAYGNCLDLTSTHGVAIVRDGYRSFCDLMGTIEQLMPENVGGDDMKGRYLDCAVLNHTCTEYLKRRKVDLDTVRAVFLEGKVLYTNAGFREQTHTQLCVRRAEAIIGYFRVDPQPQLDGL